VDEASKEGKATSMNVMNTQFLVKVIFYFFIKVTFKTWLACKNWAQNGRLGILGVKD